MHFSVIGICYQKSNRFLEASCWLGSIFVSLVVLLRFAQWLGWKSIRFLCDGFFLKEAGFFFFLAYYTRILVCCAVLSLISRWLYCTVSLCLGLIGGILCSAVSKPEWSITPILARVVSLCKLRQGCGKRHYIRGLHSVVVNLDLLALWNLNFWNIIIFFLPEEKHLRFLIVRHRFCFLYFLCWGWTLVFVRNILPSYLLLLFQ